MRSLTVFALLWCQNIVSSENVTDSATNSIENVYEDRNDFETTLHNSWEIKRLGRFRRFAPNAAKRVAFASENEFYQDFFVSRVQSVDLGIPEFSHSVFDHIPDQHIPQVLIARTNPNVLSTYQLDPHQKKFQLSISAKLALPTKKINHFKHGNTLWIVCLHQDESTSVVQLYQVEGNNITSRQTITLKGEADFQLKSVRGLIYLVTIGASSTGSEGDLTLYSWDETQFSSVASHRVSHVSDTAMFTEHGMDSPLFICVVQATSLSTSSALIFLYNRKEPDTLRYYQDIQLYHGKQVEHFFVGGVEYLAFMTGYGVQVYWYSGYKFVEWQTLPGTSGGTQLTVHYLPNGETTIAVLNQNSLSFFSQKHDAVYDMIYKYELGNHVDRIQIENIRGIGSIILTESPDPYTTLRIIFDKRVVNSAEAEQDPLLNCLSALEIKLKRTEALVKDINTQSKRVWRYNDDEGVVGDIIVDGNVRVHSGSLEGTNLQVVLEPDETTSSESKNRYPRSSNTVPQKDDVRRIQTEISDVFKMSAVGIEAEVDLIARRSIQQTWNGTYTFIKHVIAHSTHVYGGRIDTINDVSMNDLLHSAVRTDRDEIFMKPFNLHNVLYTDHITVGSVNAIRGKDILKRHGDQRITGKKILQHATFKQGIQTEVVNKVPLRNVVYLNEPYELITGEKTVDKLVVIGGLQVTKLNGVNFERFLLNAINIHDGVPIKLNGNWTFLEAISVKDNLEVGKPIDGKYDVDLFNKYAVTLHGQQEITGEKIFMAPVRIDSGSCALINGVNIQKDLVTLTTRQEVFSNLKFRSPLILKDGEALRINNIRVEDFVRKSSLKPQIIRGRKLFLKDVSVLDEITMEDGVTLNNVDPSRLYEGRGATIHIREPLTVPSMHIIGHLKSDSGINRFKISDIRYRFWTRSAPQVIPVPLKISSPTRFEKEIDPVLINGYSLHKHFLHTFGDQVLRINSGASLFIQEVQARKLTTDQTTFNGFDLKYTLQQMVTVVGPTQHVEGIVEIPEISFSNLNVAWWNAMLFNEFLSVTHQHQVITGPVIFEESLDFNDLFVNGTLSIGILNQEPVAHLLQDLVVRSNIHTKPIRNKVFQRGFSADDLKCLHGPVNGVILPLHLCRSAAVDRDQTFLRNVRFSSLMTTPLLHAEMIGDVDVGRYLKYVVVDNVPNQFVTGRKIFAMGLQVRDLQTRHVNGINLRSFLTSSMKRYGSVNIFKYPVTFHKGITARNINIRSLVNGISLEDTIPITGHKDIHLAGGMTLRKMVVNKIETKQINEVDLHHLSKNTLKLSSKDAQVINTPVVLNNLKIANNQSAIFKGTVNRLFLNQLTKMLQNKATDKMTVHGRITVKDLETHELFAHRDSSIFLKYHLAGIPVTKLSEVLSPGGDMVVASAKIFDNLAAGNIVLKSLINGVHIPEDTVLSRNTHITTPLASPSISVFNGLQVDSINGKNIDEYLRYRLSDRSPVKATVVINGDIQIENIHTQMINEIPYSDIAFSDQKNIRFTAPKKFSRPLIVDGEVNVKHMNSINIKEQLDNVACPDMHNVPGSLTFKQPLRVGHVLSPSARGFINNELEYEISKNSKLIAQQLNQQTSDLSAAKQRVEANLAKIKPLFHRFLEVQVFKPKMNMRILSLFTNPTGFSHASLKTQPVSTQLIMQIARPVYCQEGTCCEEVDTLNYKLSSFGQITSLKEVVQNDRLFSIMNPSQSYVLSSNVTGSSVCSTSAVQITKVYTLPSSSKPYISLSSFASRNINQLFSFLDLSSASVKHFKSFGLMGSDYVIIAYGFDRHTGYDGGIEILRKDERGFFKKHQYLQEEDIQAIDVLTAEDSVFLAVAKRCSRLNEQRCMSSIYKMTKDSTGGHKFIVVTRFTTHGAADIKLLITHYDYDLLCVVANEYSVVDGRKMHTEPVSVYKYDRLMNEFNEISPIPVYGATGVDVFSYARQNFLAIASPLENKISVWTWLGYPQFSFISDVPANAHSIHVYWASSRGKVMMAAASRVGEVRIYEAAWTRMCYKSNNYLQYSGYNLNPPEVMVSPHGVKSYQNISFGSYDDSPMAYKMSTVKPAPVLRTPMAYSTTVKPLDPPKSSHSVHPYHTQESPHTGPPRSMETGRESGADPVNDFHERKTGDKSDEAEPLDDEDVAVEEVAREMQDDGFENVIDHTNVGSSVISRHQPQARKQYFNYRPENINNGVADDLDPRHTVAPPGRHPL